MNEPKIWAFLGIWYENSWFWVHEVKRLVFSLYMAFVYTHPSMAAHLPCLPGSPSIPWGPHFLRSACPYPGCLLSSYSGLCPLEIIPADYWLILCFLFTDFSRTSSFRHLAVDVSPVTIPHFFQLPYHS